MHITSKSRWSPTSRTRLMLACGFWCIPTLILSMVQIDKPTYLFPEGTDSVIGLTAMMCDYYSMLIHNIIRGDNVLPIHLCYWADVIVIAPLSAHTLSRITLTLQGLLLFINFVTLVRSLSLAVALWKRAQHLEGLRRHGFTVAEEALKGQLWRLRDPQGKPPGVVGWWPSRAVINIFKMIDLAGKDGIAKVGGQEVYTCNKARLCSNEAMRAAELVKLDSLNKFLDVYC
ncbi:uncharacterized protein LOC133714369 isoform X2 [Rosa rugosa]|uniref:uncharacterized protein LOC133714369 isoform X2 n=1 Tax=Rosa rugosa TaxID=74645 RepID=UPI002B40D776|nr:uncharacterized protein LOC133714369 isoform X2 [Rosa rugosa]